MDSGTRTSRVGRTQTGHRAARSAQIILSGYQPDGQPNAIEALSSAPNGGSAGVLLLVFAAATVALHRSKDDPHVFWTTEVYADDAAFAAHRSSDVHAAASPVFTELIAAADVLIGETLIATGLGG
jgi:hypothetical protein